MGADSHEMKKRGWNSEQAARYERLTPAQRVMVDEGLPIDYMLSDEEKKEHWAKHGSQPKPFRREDPATTALRQEQINMLPSGKKPATSVAVNEDAAVISLTTNTRGNTKMAIDYATMTGPQLVTAYNEMANSQLGKELNARPVTRFADMEAGVKRCMQLESSIKARSDGLKSASRDTTTTNVAVTTGPTGQKEEDDVAKTAKKAKGAKKAPKAKKVTKTTTKEVAVSSNKRAAEFGCRVGSFREKLLIALDENYRKMVAVPRLLKAVYGSQNIENTGKLNMVLKGALGMITGSKLAYEIKKAKDEETKEISFGLYPK